MACLDVHKFKDRRRDVLEVFAILKYIEEIDDQDMGLDAGYN